MTQSMLTTLRSRRRNAERPRSGVPPNSQSPRHRSTHSTFFGKARLLKQQRMQRKRLIQEQQLKEEHEEVERDPRIKSWLAMIRQVGTSCILVVRQRHVMGFGCWQNLTNTSARIEVNSVTARVLAQALWDNSSVTCLDLSRNDLDDFAGRNLDNFCLNGISRMRIFRIAARARA